MCLHITAICSFIQQHCATKAVPCFKTSRCPALTSLPATISSSYLRRSTPWIHRGEHSSVPLHWAVNLTEALFTTKWSLNKTVAPTGGYGGRGREPPERAPLLWSPAGIWWQNVTQPRPESCSSPEPGRPTSSGGPTIMMTTAAFVQSRDGKITGACLNVRTVKYRTILRLNLLQNQALTFLHGLNGTLVSGLRISTVLGSGRTGVHQTGNQDGLLLEGFNRSTHIWRNSNQNRESSGLQ